jgi:hypothetical protein
MNEMNERNFLNESREDRGPSRQSARRIRGGRPSGTIRSERHHALPKPDITLSSTKDVSSLAGGPQA